jgi:hypothetical protein
MTAPSVGRRGPEPEAREQQLRDARAARRRLDTKSGRAARPDVTPSPGPVSEEIHTTVQRWRRAVRAEERARAKKRAARRHLGRKSSATETRQPRTAARPKSPAARSTQPKSRAKSPTRRRPKRQPSRPVAVWRRRVRWVRRRKASAAVTVAVVLVVLAVRAARQAHARAARALRTARARWQEHQRHQAAERRRRDRMRGIETRHAGCARCHGTGRIVRRSPGGAYAGSVSCPGRLLTENRR